MTTSDQPLADEVETALAAFVDDDPGRSVAVGFLMEGGGPPHWSTLHIAGDVARPVASVLKIALVMALYDAAAGGRLSLGEEVAVSELGETRYCSIMRAFDPGRRLTLAELSSIALITSDNPIAVLLETRVGRDAVDAVLRQALGRGDRRMAAGFSEGELGVANRANEMSALDVLRLLDTLRAKPRYKPIIEALENNLRNNRIPALLPDEAVIAHKTGSLAGVVNDAGIVRLGEVCFAAAFLADGQADAAATSADIAACSERLFRLLTKR